MAWLKTNHVMSQPTRFTLSQADIPKQWYNLNADFPEPLPMPLHPGTKQPVTPDLMTAMFPENLVRQEMCPDRWVEVPEPVRDIYALWRPTPLLRAVRLEQALQTPAHIYYKYEGASPAGQPQAQHRGRAGLFQQEAGTKRLATETGAGQWGSSLALACKLFGLECNVYMVKVSYQQKPYRKHADAHLGRHGASEPQRPDELRPQAAGAKIRIAPAAWASRSARRLRTRSRTPNTKYSLGSVLNHVCLHQTVIGQESIKQMEMAGEEPDVIIGCVGGGSNFAGIAFPFIQQNIKDGKKYRIVAVEPSACPSLTTGELRYDFGDTAEMTPLMMMYTLGHKFMPPTIHAGGLRYHGMAPMVSHALKLGLIEAQAVHQTKVFEAGTLLCAHRGHRPRPGIGPRHRCGGAGGDRSARSREETGHPVQPFRPRSARSQFLRKLPVRQDSGCLTRATPKPTS